MQSRAFILTFVLLTAGLFGCDSTIIESESDDHINFSALAVGQQSRYIRFDAGSIYTDENPPFTYRQDTLMVSVISATDSGFVFHEQVTPGSVILQNDSLYIPEANTYHVAIRDNKLFLSKISGDYLMSNIFLIRQLPLTPIQQNRIVLDGVNIELEAQTLNEEGYILHHEQFGTIYPHLNVIKDWSAMAVDGPGYTMAYSASAGIVRAFTTSAWTGTSHGWDLAL